ncbi:head-tail adaptor protein [Roseitalea porphyridii]|uniref:Head-tail adaptor protein n=1 Tax=Roseitalea porphyridii TaxID=1852022 RepID=A0A4P6UYK2_9HYPH|nr:head-tail adaptor protein [Roseitalea porphyridii]QBK30092.1 head-tail adaptor protein [Roseitalea porphyridii]
MAREPVDPGRLRTQFALQQLSAAPDAHGGFTEVWTHVAFVWGVVEATGPSEPVRAGDAEPVIARTIVLRADPRVQPAMRLIAGTERFIVGTVHDPDMTGRFLECRVETEVPA